MSVLVGRAAGGRKGASLDHRWFRGQMARVRAGVHRPLAGVDPAGAPPVAADRRTGAVSR
jgi:hypothetical protein